MIQLNYEETKKAVLLTLLSNDYRVPMIMGDRGCGKTTMASDIADELNGVIINIDANTLKEGEITGMPSIVNTIDPFTKEPRLTCTYATHVKLQKCNDLFNIDNCQPIILFIDECNRCDSIVKREIMNLILNREINGYVLPPTVKVVAACNPSSDFSDYRDMDYQVEDMDEAQKDRFRWIEMKSDIFSWIKWAISIDPYSTDETDNTMIHKDVYEFLMDREEFLNNINTSKDDIKTSPRSWQAVSNTYRAWLKNRKKYYMTENDLLHSISGDIGVNVASDFLAFVEDNRNPLIKPNELFEGTSVKTGSIDKDLSKVILNESILRKNVLVHNCLSYIKNLFRTEGKDNFSRDFLNKEKIFIELISKTINNADLMYAILSDMKTSSDAIDKEYLKHILSLNNINIIHAFTRLNQAF